MRISIATMEHLDDLVLSNLAMAKETEGRELDLETVRMGARAVIEDPAKGHYLVAVEDGRVIGQLMVTHEWSDWRNGDIWWVQSVHVSPERRGRGVLSRLLERLTDSARMEGVAALRLYVDRDNHSAKKAYERLGFVHSHYDMFEMTL